MTILKFIEENVTFNNGWQNMANTKNAQYKNSPRLFSTITFWVRATCAKTLQGSYMVCHLTRSFRQLPASFNCAKTVLYIYKPKLFFYNYKWYGLFEIPLLHFWKKTQSVFLREKIDNVWFDCATCCENRCCLSSWCVFPLVVGVFCRCDTNCSQRKVT